MRGRRAGCKNVIDKQDILSRDKLGPDDVKRFPDRQVAGLVIHSNAMDRRVQFAHEAK